MTLDQYIAALKAHDWNYEYSDDHSVWRRGSEARRILRDAQQHLDPDYKVWNAHAPAGHRIGEGR